MTHNIVVCSNMQPAQSLIHNLHRLLLHGWCCRCCCLLHSLLHCGHASKSRGVENEMRTESLLEPTTNKSHLPHTTELAHTSQSQEQKTKSNRRKNTHCNRHAHTHMARPKCHGVTRSGSSRSNTCHMARPHWHKTKKQKQRTGQHQTIPNQR